METKFSEDQGALLRLIQASQEARVHKLVDGRELLIYQGQIVADAKPRTRPTLDALCLETLTSLAVLMTERENCVIRVQSPAQVMVIDVSEPEKHQVIATVKAVTPSLGVLADYVPLDRALIELRQFFEQDPVIHKLSAQLSKVKIEDITEIQDDGIGMNVTVLSRVQGKGQDATAFNLELTPFRTFPELLKAGLDEDDQVPFAPSSMFTMRWMKDDKNVKVFLVEQGYIQWRYLQMQKVAAYLSKLLPEAVVLV